MSNSDQTSAQTHEAEAEYQYLLLTAGGVHFALPILTVREILEPPTMTHVPMAPEWFEGLTNLRGQVLPVINLARRLNIVAAEKPKRTVLVVVDLAGQNGVLQRGLLVDILGGIIAGRPEDIKAYDGAQTTIAREYITGLLPLTPHFAFLIDLDRVFSAVEEVIAPPAGNRHGPPGRL